MVDKKEKCKELIKNNPKLSGNKLYEQSKVKGFGIKKTDFYKLIREIRNLPEPTQEKKEKSIPIKYKEPYKIIEKLPIPKKEGSYGVVELVYIDEGEEYSYWIKYETKKSLRKQFRKIKDKYKVKKLFIKFHGIKSYQEFITKQIRELLIIDKIEV